MAEKDKYVEFEMPTGNQGNLPFKPFDINEGARPVITREGGEFTYRLPSMDHNMVFSVEDYTAKFKAAATSIGGITFLAKDLGMSLPPSTQSFARISYMPNNSTSQLGILQWPGLPPETLQKLAREMISVSMIISTRCTDMMRFASISDKVWRPGWNIKPLDPDQKLNSTLRSEIRDAEQFLMNSGYGSTFSDPLQRDQLLRPSFSKFLLEILRDSLTYDGIAIWTDVDGRGQIRSFAPLPAKQIRLLARADKAQTTQAQQGQINFYGATSMAGKQPDLQEDDLPFAVVVDETNNPVKSFKRSELIWYTRNPRIDAEIGAYGYSEIEQGLMLVTGFNNAIQFNCYSEDTEVLTRTGWKLFKDVNIETDEFATLNINTNKMEWQKSRTKIWKSYEGPMYSIRSRSLDLLVTPEHKLLLQSKPKAAIGGQSWHSERKGKVGRKPDKELYRTQTTAEEFYNESPDYIPQALKGKLENGAKYSEYWNIPVTADWSGTEITEKSFKALDNTIIIMSGDEYCAFMGMYLAEGSIGSSDTKIGKSYTRVNIAQCTHTKGFVPFKSLLTKILGEEPNHANHNFGINNKELATHVSQFGKDCYSKFIPEEIMNATPEQIKIFWDYMVLGDGREQKSNKGIYKTERRGKLNGDRFNITTTSKKMAEQLQELTMKMGYSSYIYTTPAGEATVPVLIKSAVGDWEYIPESRKVCQAAESYEICLKYARAHPFAISKTENYKGYIGCVSVENGTIFVRRNGKVAWSRQSDIFDKNSIPKGILAIKGNFTQRQFDALNRIWDNLQRGNRTDWTLPALQLSEKGEIELINLEPLRKENAYYANLVNLFMGALATVYCIPPHRLGYKISGTERDSRPDTPKSLQEEEDVGIAVLLGHIEILINDYLLHNRWPHLQFSFTGKTPKEDARLYEISLQATTIDERRQMVGLDPYESLIDKDATDMEFLIARLMGRAPVDPAMAGIYQSLLAAMAKAGAFNALLGLPVQGGGEGGKGGGTGESGLGDLPGARFKPKKDPAESEKHGHMSGVRRTSSMTGPKPPPNLRKITQSPTTPDTSSYSGTKGSNT